MLDRDAWYNALLKRDKRAWMDGHVYIAVSSTGIYCRPTCSARLPKPENLSYFSTASQAEAAGFRPCLQCFPEIAPDVAPSDKTRTPAHMLARAIKEHSNLIGTSSTASTSSTSRFSGTATSLDIFMTEHGMDPAATRASFQDVFGITPEQHLLSCRMLMAKQLVGGTRLPFDQVAASAGFSSQEEMEQLFKKRYKLALSDMRRRGGNPDEDGFITLQLCYRPPYDWERIIAFLELRAIPGVELVRDGVYYRTARIPLSAVNENDKGAGNTPAEPSDPAEALGWLSVQPTPKKNALTARVSLSLVGVLPQVIARLRHLFDLDCDPESVEAGLDAFQNDCPGKYTPGTRVPGCFDPYEMTCRAILGQQISVKGASTLAGRMATAAGTPIETPIAGLSCAFPGPTQVCALEDPGETLGSLGIIGRRMKTMVAFAESLENGSLKLEYGADPVITIPTLEALPGIGPWTAQYIAMRTTGFTDAFPSTDLGVKKALAPRQGKEIDAAAAAWSPWRAYATMSLWCSFH